MSFFRGAQERRLAATFETTLEIEGRAARLAAQIAAREADAGMALGQIGEIEEQLARHGEELPPEIRTRVGDCVRSAQSAAMAGDLEGVTGAARTIRDMLEQFRSAALTDAAR